jgi:hypothetical protein
MGFVYQRMGETARACAFYAKAVATDPGLRRARDNWTRTCKPDGDGSGNLSLAPAATPLSPGTSPAGLSSDSSADPASLSPSPRDASPNVAPPTPPPGTSPGVSPASISQGPSSGVTSPSQPLAGAARAKELRP